MALLACVAIVALSSPAAGAKAGKPPRDHNLQRLWSEYPLNPEPSVRPRPSPGPAPAEPIGHRPTPTPSKGGGSDALLAAFLVIVALVLTAGAAAAWRWRRLLPRGARGRSQAQEEGETMSDLVRRLLGEDREETSEAAAGAKSRHPATLERMQAYSTKGDEAMHEKPVAAPEAREPESYAHLGEHVGAILKATEKAAEEMRHKAQEDADKTRREAEQAAAATREEAKTKIEAERRELEKLRAELEQRTQQVHAEADTYREQTRRQAEAEAREIRARANEAAKQLQEDARRLQGWMEGTLTAFHEVAGWLEDALAKAGGAAETQEASLEEALKPKDYAKST